MGLPLARVAAAALLVLGALVAVGSAMPAPAGADVATPSWWSGTCDATVIGTPWPRLMGWKGAGARTSPHYLGVPGVCGPRPSANAEDSPDVQWTKRGWGEYEWECTELAFRFMAQIYGVHAYEADRLCTVVSHYSTADGGGLVKVIANGDGRLGPGNRGDVMSFSDGGLGHAAVVSATNVNGSGTGTITLISQNDTANGWRTLTVTRLAGAALPGPRS